MLFMSLVLKKRLKSKLSLETEYLVSEKRTELSVGLTHNLFFIKRNFKFREKYIIYKI